VQVTVNVAPGIGAMLTFKEVGLAGKINVMIGVGGGMNVVPAADSALLMPFGAAKVSCTVHDTAVGPPRPFTVIGLVELVPVCAA
jgi:hypothetical protein